MVGYGECAGQAQKRVQRPVALGSATPEFKSDNNFVNVDYEEHNGLTNHDVVVALLMQGNDKKSLKGNNKDTVSPRKMVTFLMTRVSTGNKISYLLDQH